MAAVEGASRHGSSVGDTTHDLYRRYGKQIYAYCYHRLRSREEAEDAVQTTFMNAFRSLQRGATAQYEQAWLFKIAQNVCIARHSSSSRRLRLEAPNDLEALQEVVPAREGEEPLELIGIEEALERMPENQRRAILLREWQGLSYREIADELGLSQAAVEMLIFRARRTLAGALEQPGEEKKHRVGRKVGSLGSLVGALKTLFGGGAAIKAVAVAAATVAVVGESASHTIVRPATHASAPAPKAAVPSVHAQSVAAAVAPSRTPVQHVVHRPRAHRAVQAPTRAPAAPPVVAAPAPAVVAAPAVTTTTTTVAPPPPPQPVAAPQPAAPPVETPREQPKPEEPKTHDQDKDRERQSAAVTPPPTASPTPAPVETPPPPTTTTTTAAPTTIEPQAALDHGAGHGRFKKLDVPSQPPAATPALPPATQTTATTTTTTTTAAAAPTPPPLTVTTPVVASSPPLPSVDPPGRGKGLALGHTKQAP